MSGIWDSMIQGIEDLGHLLDSFLIKDDQGNIVHKAMVVAIGVPIIMIFCVCYVTIENDVPMKMKNQ